MNILNFDFEKFLDKENYPDYHTESAYIKIVNVYPHLFTHLINPSESVKRALIRSKPSCFSEISNPSEELCILAVQCDPILLSSIEKQTPAICLEALKTKWDTSIYDSINIPIEGEFLREFNRMKLLSGPMSTSLTYDVGFMYCPYIPITNINIKVDIK